MEKMVCVPIFYVSAIKLNGIVGCRLFGSPTLWIRKYWVNDKAVSPTYKKPHNFPLILWIERHGGSVENLKATDLKNGN